MLSMLRLSGVQNQDIASVCNYSILVDVAVKKRIFHSQEFEQRRFVVLIG